MKITLTGKQVDIGDRLRNHVEENVLNSVNKYFPAPISCTVAFSKDGDDFCAEVTVHPAKNIVLKVREPLVILILPLTMPMLTSPPACAATKQTERPQRQNRPRRDG